ncbi:MAG TPA: response regulator transcription factor [Bacteroidales bacterium]|nr:response regulator transcription factor [Bacteroidales bacterium]
MDSIRVHIVDDHTLFREGLKFLLSTTNYIPHIDESENGLESIQNIANISPDIVLMDIEMPIMDGITATRQLMQTYPDLKIIALSMYGYEHYYSQMIDAGARGFLLKHSDFGEVQKAICEVYKGNTYFSPEILDAIIKNLYKKKDNKPIQTELTEREIEILYNICKGFSNAEIADNLCISKRTVDKHRENLLLKTESKNTAGLVIYAIKNGLFEV